MAVITVMNMKGGVGKTTVTAHVGSGLAILDKKKVLLIDYDPQFNLSQMFIRHKQYFQLEKECKTSLAILHDDETKLHPFEIQSPASDVPPPVAQLAITVVRSMDKRQAWRVDIIPSTLKLMYVALGDYSKTARPLRERFASFVSECRSVYDYVFIDCHPSGSVLTQTSLKNSDHVLVPVSPSRFAERGVGLMKQFIETSSSDKNVPHMHILFNAVHRTFLTDDEGRIRNNNRYKDMCLNNTLKKYKIFSEPSEGAGFVWDSGKPYSSEASRNLGAVATELRDRILAGGNVP